MTISAKLNGETRSLFHGIKKQKGLFNNDRLFLLIFCFSIFAFCFLFLAGPEDVIASQRVKIALFPFENFSEDMNAQKYVMPVLKDRLEAMGLDVLDNDSLDRFLLKERVRSTGYIPKDLAKKIEEELDVEAVLVGSINTFYPGENPKVGFTARLINSSDGTIFWADHASATGQDFTKILGIGTVHTIDRLIPKVIDKLFESFSITPPYKEKEAVYNIAVMPFQNKSKIENAGMIVSYMFIAELFKSEFFEPLSYGEVRRLIVDLRVRGKGELNFKNTEAISKSSGVDGILVGTVELYTEEEGTTPAKAEMSARLIDAHNGRILWYDGYEYDGDKGISILDWGKLRSAEQVADKVISTLVKEMSNAEWQ